MKAAICKLKEDLYRYGYYAAMHSGLRAAYNRARAPRGLPDERLRRLNSVTVGDGVLCDAWVHTRPHSTRRSKRDRHGMISLRLRRSPLPRWLYHVICATSHFGDGHFEIAFYWRDDVVTFYAIRNIAEGSARRLGLTATAERLRLTKSRESIQVLRSVAAALAAIGVRCNHASAEECIALSVDDRLLTARARSRAITHWRRRYRSLHAQFAALTSGQSASTAPGITSSA